MIIIDATEVRTYDVIGVVMAWLQAVDQDFFAKGFGALLS
jgi:hypothetical protein